MKPLFILLFSLYALAATAQVPQANVLSLQVWGGHGYNQVGTLATKTSDGGFIICIGTDAIPGTGNIDSFCALNGDRIIFLKYNADASILEWVKCYMDDGDTDLGYIFPTLDSGNILGGTFNSSGFYICKQNALGSILWSHSYSEGNGPLLFDMIATSDGGYIMAGETFYTDTNFTVHYGSWMNADIGVLKLDSLGNKVWCTVLGGTGDEQCGAVIEGPDNSCYVIGTTPSDDYDCTGNHGDSSGTPDMYIARLDNSGNILWHHDLGGTGYDGGKCGWPDGMGGVIIGGNTNSYNGDVTRYVGGIWMVDVDSNGIIIWNNTYGDSSNESPNTICKAIDGTIWIAGASGTRGGEIDTAYGSTDAWFVHTDNIGNFLSAKVLGSSAQDEGSLIYPLSSGNVIGGGYNSDSGGTFPDIYYGGSDAFLTIFAPWPESVQQINTVNNAVKIYPNPAEEIVTVEAVQKDNYTVVITDLLGRIIYIANLINKVQVPIGTWQTGMYYVQVVGENGFSNVQKLIVR